MGELEVSRTLLKSAPELWSECSDAASLARHLGNFRDIRVTSLEPESTVAWEGAAARGTVRLEPAGWGTRVVLTAVRTDIPPAPETPAPGTPARDPETLAPETLAPETLAPETLAPETLAPETLAPEALAPEALAPETREAPDYEGAPDPDPQAPRGRARRLWERVLARWRRRRSRAVAVAPLPAPVAEPEPPAPVAPPEPVDDETLELLSQALDSLGQAHHRPYSRA